MKQHFKKIISYFYSLGNLKLTKGASIPMYHSVSSKNDRFSTVSPEAFEKQLRYLADNDFKVVFVSEIVERLKNNQSIAGLVSLTFDDGREDFYHNAFPLLKKYRLKASLFVITRYIGDKYVGPKGQSYQVVSESEIKEMTDSGLVEIMPHTESHPKLNKLECPEAVREIEGSLATVKNISRSSPAVLSYPYGRYTEELVDYINYHTTLEAAVTVEYGLATERSNLGKLPRNCVSSDTTLSLFKVFLSNRIETFKRFLQ